MHGQGQGDPHRLVGLPPGVFKAAPRRYNCPTIGPTRQHHAHEAQEDGHERGRTAHRQRGQVDGRQARATSSSVHGGEGQHGQLADQHRPGQRRDAAHAVQPRKETREETRAQLRVGAHRQTLSGVAEAEGEVEATASAEGWSSAGRQIRGRVRRSG